MTSPLTNLAPAIVFSDDRKVIASSPYPAAWPEVKQRFGFNAHRQALAARFEAWVAAATAIVIPDFIWIGGSFVSGKPEPADVDAVMFFRYREAFADARSHQAFLNTHKGVLSRPAVLGAFGVDCATVALTMPVERLIAISAEWTMILSGNPDGTRRAFYTVPAASVA